MAPVGRRCAGTDRGERTAPRPYRTASSREIFPRWYAESTRSPGPKSGGAAVLPVVVRSGASLNGVGCGTGGAATRGSVCGGATAPTAAGAATESGAA